jgi:hypothetical protein
VESIHGIVSAMSMPAAGLCPSRGAFLLARDRWLERRRGEAK